MLTSPFWCHHKKMRGGEVFKAAPSFPPEELPTKGQVIERMLNFPDYRTLGAARNVAQVEHQGMA